MLFSIIVIVGSIVGSGFITGKEIAVFFARSGIYAYLGILLSMVLFFIITKYILINSEKIIKKLTFSKVFQFISLALNTILSSAMIASVVEIACKFNKFVTFIILSFTIFFCLYIFKKSSLALKKLNLIFVPFMLICFILFLFSKIKFSFDFQSGDIFSSIWFSLLYDFLNLSNLAILIASMGQKLSKKQKVQVALLSTLALSFLLLMTTTVLLQNQSVLCQNMPLLSLCNAFQKWIMSGLILLGSETSLFSFVYMSSSSLRGLNKNETTNFIISLLLPFVISLFGFGFIVEELYPLASVLGVLLLGMIFNPKLFFHPLFKNVHKKIHSARQNAEENDAGHNDIKF